MVRQVDDLYILQLDELPKCVEADGTIYPIYLPLREASRLFHVNPATLASWVERFGIPVLRASSTMTLVSVADLAEFIRENTFTREEMRARWRTRRAVEQALAERHSALLTALDGVASTDVGPDEDALVFAEPDPDADTMIDIEDEQVAATQ